MEVTEYIEMFVEYFVMFINYVKQFLAGLGIVDDDAEE